MPKIATKNSGRSRADHAYRTLKAQILSGELSGGTWLRQHEVARALGIATNPLREALILLHRDGLVELEPNMGAKVRQWRPEDFIRQFEVRIPLESELAMLATERITPDELRTLVDMAYELDTHKIEHEDDLYGLFERDVKLHRFIAQAARSEKLLHFWEVAIIRPLHDRPKPKWKEHLQLCQPWSHMLLVQAIALGDPEQARQAARRHVVYSRAIDVQVLGLGWQFSQYQTDAVPVDVDEDQFRKLLEER